MNTCVRYEISENENISQRAIERTYRREVVVEFSNGMKLLTCRKPTDWLRMVYSTLDSLASFVKGDRISNARNSGIVNKFLFGPPPPSPDVLFLLPSSFRSFLGPLSPGRHSLSTTYSNNRWFGFQDVFKNETDTAELIFSPL